RRLVGGRADHHGAVRRRRCRGRAAVPGLGTPRRAGGPPSGVLMSPGSDDRGTGDQGTGDQGWGPAWDERMVGVLTPTFAAELRAACHAADYTVPGVVEAIGEPAHRALGRNSTVPAVRALAGRDDPLATMIMVFILQRPVPRQAIEAAFPGLVPAMIDAGLLRAADGAVTAVVDLRPYATDDTRPYWVVADLTPGLDTVITPIRPDYVLGV